VEVPFFGSQLSAYSNFDYLTATILGRATFGDNVKFFVNGGIFLGYLIKQTGVVGALEVENTDDFERLDFGPSVGVGLAIPVGDKFLISFEPRYNLGLLNISKSSNNYDETQRTNSINFLIGFAYRFGGR